MFRRILAALLAVLLILLTFGCGKGTEEPEPTAKDAPKIDGKIAIVIGDRSQSPEIYAAASEILSANPDSVLLLKYDEDFYSNPNAVSNVATAVAQNNAVKAILFADGVKGTGAAVKAVRAAREDVCIIVCNPHEGSVGMHDADLILSVDFPALGEAMVEKARDLGAENFVFYTTERYLKYVSVVALQRALKLACEDKEMTFKPSNSIDLYEDGKTLDDAKQYITEDVQRKAEKFGEKTALVCTEPMVQGALAAQAIKSGLYMPGTFLPSPYALAADLGVDLVGHETDAGYALEQLKATGAAGHVATWSFSAYTTFLQAAFDYAVSAANGTDKKLTVEDVQKLIEKHTAGASVTVSTDANFAYLVQSELVTL